MQRNPLYGYLSLLAACAFLWVSCGHKDEPEVSEVRVEGVSVTPSILTMTEGDISSLTVTVLPENAQNKTVLWSSSREDVAIVSDGVVVAVSPGMATIKAESEDGGKSAICLVTVVARVVPVTAVTLDKNNLEMEVGETVSLAATVKPDNATDKSVTWSTSDSEVATVNNGVVTALKTGTAIITAKAGEKSATCTITVKSTVSDGENEDVGFEVWND